MRKTILTLLGSAVLAASVSQIASAAEHKSHKADRAGDGERTVPQLQRGVAFAGGAVRLVAVSRRWRIFGARGPLNAKWNFEAGRMPRPASAFSALVHPEHRSR